ncbi:MAG: hypothetical protein ABR541_09220 [Candidatus Dormibacteria bacterium]
MTPLGVAGVWLVSGIGSALLLPRVRRRRLAWVVPALAAASALLVGSTSAWSGRAGSGETVSALTLGRPAIGLLAAAGLAVAAALALSPVLDGGEVLCLGMVGAAVTLLLAASTPLVYGLAACLALAALSIRWIGAAPGPGTLAAGRVGGLGAAAVVGAAAFVPPAGGAFEPRAVLGGSLLVAGIAAMLGLVPLGGWLAGAAASLRGIDLVPWVLLLAPALVVTSGVLSAGLVVGGQIPFNNVLLVLGLVSATYGAFRALRCDPGARYARVVIADLALAAAGTGTYHAIGRSGSLVIVLSHLLTAPLLLHPARPGLGRQRRVAWLALTGVPPTPAFWGRFLVLLGAFAASPLAGAAALLAVALLFFASVGALTAPEGAPGATGLAAGRATRWLGWAVALLAIALGLAPQAAARAVFG